MHAEFRTLELAVAWLQERIADHIARGGKEYDFAINYHAPRTECATPVNALFIAK